MISVHLREQEIAYESTTKRPRGLHDHYRGTDPDPDRICSRREGAWGPPAGTKRPGHGRGYHSLRRPRRDSHSPVIRFRFRQSHEPSQNRYGQHNAVQTLPLYNRGYLRCPAMADAMAVSGDCHIPVIRSSCPASEPVPEVTSVWYHNDPASECRGEGPFPGFRNTGFFVLTCNFILL